jgi:hypothetical protein
LTMREAIKKVLDSHDPAACSMDQPLTFQLPELNRTESGVPRLATRP